MRCGTAPASWVSRDSHSAWIVSRWPKTTESGSLRLASTLTTVPLRQDGARESKLEWRQLLGAGIVEERLDVECVEAKRSESVRGTSRRSVIRHGACGECEWRELLARSICYMCAGLYVEVGGRMGCYQKANAS